MEMKELRLGYKIKKIREFKNVTQKQIADALGITQSAYSKIEMGETEIPYSRLEKISTVLGVKPEEIISFNEHMIFNVMNNPNGGNLFGNITYTISDAERKLYEQQIDFLKEELAYMKKLLEIAMRGDEGRV
jgi:transcriptional regulator with XRE-family HTH domain